MQIPHLGFLVVLVAARRLYVTGRRSGFYKCLCINTTPVPRQVRMGAVTPIKELLSPVRRKSLANLITELRKNSTVSEKLAELVSNLLLHLFAVAKHIPQFFAQLYERHDSGSNEICVYVRDPYSQSYFRDVNICREAGELDLICQRFGGLRMFCSRSRSLVSRELQLLELSLQLLLGRSLFAAA